MLSRHVSRDLARYADGDFGPAEARAVESHLARCERCRAALAEHRFAAGLVRQLSLSPAPPSIWSSIEDALSRPATTRARAASLFSFPRLAFACVLVLAAVAAALYFQRGFAPSQTNNIASNPWEVVRVGGSRVGGSGVERLAPGDFVRTDGVSRATIKVGQLGTVDVEPDTRVRLGQSRPAEFRIALERGTIAATINAPPRLFIVDTPTSTVVDLGCAYTMHVGEDGGGELRVTSGWTSLEWRGRESLVPAGAEARTRPGVGPGTPFFGDASPAFRDALLAFDFQSGGAAALAVVLAESRMRDTLTLWHLMSRVEPADRARVYDRIAGLTPPPATVSREKALQLDPSTLKVWREELAWSW
jgi:hypothetical protein